MLESTVKEAVRELIESYGPAAWQHWPVVTRFGATHLDVIGAIRGFAFVVECKRPGEEPTKRQRERLADCHAAGTACFVVDHPAAGGIEQFKQWLDECFLFSTKIPATSAPATLSTTPSGSTSGPTSTRSRPASPPRASRSVPRKDSTAPTAPTATRKSRTDD